MLTTRQNDEKLSPAELTSLVDQIGHLRAAIKPLKDDLNGLEKQLKDQGTGTYHGHKFRATVFEFVGKTINWKKIAAKFSPSIQLITAHTKANEGIRLKISAHSKS